MEQLQAVPTSASPVMREIMDLPGPHCLPLLGNALLIKPTSFHLSLERWRNEYGPFFRVRLGPKTLLVAADHGAVGAALRERPGMFRRMERLEQVAEEMRLDPGLFVAEGKDWEAQRRMVMAGLDPQHVRAYFPALLRVAERLQHRWERSAHEGRDVDLQADLMRFTVDAIAGLAFGADVDTLGSGDDVIQRHLNLLFPAISRRVLQPPLLRYFHPLAERRLARSVAAVKHAIRGFIAAARARLQADPALRDNPSNLLEAMIAAAESAGSAGGMDDRHIAGNVLTMLLAGEDTTANTLAWMIHLLARHPEALAQAQQEVQDVLGCSGSIAACSYEQFAGLTYIEACMHETMRLKPVAPFIVLQANQETAIGDVHVPADAAVILMLRSDCLDERFFPDPKGFSPERWLAPSGAGSHAPQAVHAAAGAKRVSMPFGAGPRVCPGRHLSMLEMKVPAAMLFYRFDIEGVDTPHGGEAEERLDFTMAPVGLRMRLRLREAN